MKKIGDKTKTKMALIEATLAALPVKTIRDDEFLFPFYVQEREKAGDHRSIDGHRATLKRLCDEGKVKKRKVVIDGKECNAYSLA